MGVEIEKKFLLKNNDWKKSISNSFSIKQGYLNANPERTVRIRVLDDKAFITIKSKSIGITRQEFEYEIPKKDGLDLLVLCEKPLIEKTRNIVIHATKTWEIDEFEGVNSGLIVAEIELASEKEKFILPSWLSKEVSSELKYYNSSLINLPFSKW